MPCSLPFSFSRFALLSLCACLPLFAQDPSSTLAESQASSASEYFVKVDGSDANDGLAEDRAFATIQKGIDQLQPGDTLTIGPGEYYEAIRRDNLGSAEAETRIRAQFPGTVLLRGDKPAPEFRAAPNIPGVFETDFKGEVEAVSEVDTLTLFSVAASADDLQFLRGRFFHDTAMGKLYISTSDLKSADTHRYTVSVTNKCGIFLSKPQRVTLEGLATTGYNSATARSLKPATEQGTVWGIWLFNPDKCVVRQCRSYLNGGGIGLQSSKTTGGNVVENCIVYADGSPIVASGGIIIYGANGDTVRDCLAFHMQPRHYAFRFYAGDGGVGPGYSVMENNIALSGDISQKGDKLNELASVRDCVTLAELHSYHVANSICGQNRYRTMGAEISDTLFLTDQKNLDFNSEFADSVNGDFRLQSTSRFLKMKDGKAAGLSLRAGRVFFLRPDGNDVADGLSLGNAWKTWPRAIKALQPGDTLYLSRGRYEGDASISLRRPDQGKTFIRARGNETVIIAGKLDLSKSSGLEFERLQFLNDVSAGMSEDIAFSDCLFAGQRQGLSAIQVTGLRVVQCAFMRFREAAISLTDSSKVFLQGNIYDNQFSPALEIDNDSALLYSDYNSFSAPDQALARAGAVVKMDATGHEKYSSIVLPRMTEDKDGAFVLADDSSFGGRGPVGKAIGPNRLSTQTEVVVSEPAAHAVGATTANLEWQTSGPMVCRVGWGTTPECSKQEEVEADQFGTFSLNNLNPDTTYYFRVLSVQPVNFSSSSDEGEDTDNAGGANVSATTMVSTPPISFKTAKIDLPPKTYYVSPDGDNNHSGLERSTPWRTISYAASRVNVGDTVLVAGGEYQDRVRIRATGKADAPISFRAIEGEKVFITGGKKQTSPAFLISRKKHQRIDGFYLKNFNPNGGKWDPLQHAGVFVLANAEDVEITRCFYEGRSPGLSPGYSPFFLWADHSSRVLVKNCVMIRGFHHIGLVNCADSVIANNVLLQSMISQIDITGRSRNIQIENNIITDSLPVKVTASLIYREAREGIDFQNNDFFLRIPYLERNYVFFGKGSPANPSTPEERLALQKSTKSLFVDPEFAIWKKVAADKKTPEGKFSVDYLLKLDGPFDFPDLFATNPEVLDRDMGLQPKAWPSATTAVSSP